MVIKSSHDPWPYVQSSTYACNDVLSKCLLDLQTPVLMSALLLIVRAHKALLTLLKLMAEGTLRQWLCTCQASSY